MLKTPSGVGCKEGCLFSSRLEDLGVLNGDRREVPQAVYIFWRILKATKRSFLNLYADALSSSISVTCHISGKAEVWGAMAPIPLNTYPNVEPPIKSCQVRKAMSEERVDGASESGSKRRRYAPIYPHWVI